MGTKVTRLRRVPTPPRSGGRTTAARQGPTGAYPTVGSAALAPVPRERRDTPAPQLRVAPPPPVAVPRAPFVLLVLLLVVGGVVGILLLNTKINENAFLLHDLRDEQAALDLRQQQLEQELAEANSTTRLAAAATRLGLVQRPKSQLPHLRVPSGEVRGGTGSDRAGD